MNYINISIDDVTPHPQSSVRVLDRCYNLIKTFPNIKFTLYVPTCYTRKDQRSFNILDFPNFLNILSNLDNNNFELGYHGHYHGVIHENSNNELMINDYDEAVARLKLMMNTIDEAGLRYTSVLRPPAWRMAPYCIQAAQDLGIQILTLSKDDYALETYQGKDKEFPKVVYYDCAPPFKPLILKQTTEIVYHACEWDKSYLSLEKEKELTEFLTTNINSITFSFINNLWVSQTV